MIDNENKIIFIAIPKTGTTSIEKIFFDVRTTFVDGKHDTIFEIIQKCQKQNISISDYYKFTMVRNPYERIKSCYRYILKRLKFKNKKLPKDFKTWLKNPYGDQPKLWASQSSFINDDVVWFKLEDDWDVMIKCVSTHILPQHNTNLKLNFTKNIDIELDNESIKLINDMYKEDFINFGYEMIKVK